MAKRIDRTPRPARVVPPLHPLADPAGLFVDDSRREGISLEASNMAGGRATAVELERFSMRDVNLSESAIEDLSLHNGTLVGCDLANVRFPNCALTRVAMKDCRLTGAGLAECRLQDVVFDGCTIDLAFFSFGKFNRVRFERCGLKGCDFQGVEARRSAFVGSDLSDVQLSQGSFDGCLVRDCRFDGVRGLAALKGVEMGWPDLVELAPALAGSIGIVVEGDAEES